MLKLLFFDSETTGLDSGKNGMHQMSGSVVIDGVVKEYFDIKFQPFKGCKIVEEALKVSGLTKKDLKKREMTDKDAYQQLCDIMSKYVDKYNKKDKFFLVGYNVGFDLSFLHELFKRNEDKYLNSYIWSNSIDVMTLAGFHLMNVRQNMFKFRQLDVLNELKIEFNENELHDALYDIIMCMKIYEKVSNTNIKWLENQ